MIQVQTVGGKVMESGDARDVKKRDREDPETLETLGTQKKKMTEEIII